MDIRWSDISSKRDNLITLRQMITFGATFIDNFLLHYSLRKKSSSVQPCTMQQLMVFIFDGCSFHVAHV